MMLSSRNTVYTWFLLALGITVFSVVSSAPSLGTKRETSVIGCGHTVNDKEIGKRLRLARSSEDVYCRVKLPGYTTIRFYPNGPAKNSSFVLYTGAIDENRFRHRSATLTTKDTLWRQDLIIHCSKGGLLLVSGTSVTFKLERMRERDVIPTFNYSQSHPCPEESDRSKRPYNDLF